MWQWNLKIEILLKKAKVKPRSIRFTWYMPGNSNKLGRTVLDTPKKTIIWPWGQRSLLYVTHRLMVMHPHTKYHWPISLRSKGIHNDIHNVFQQSFFIIFILCVLTSLSAIFNSAISWQPVIVVEEAGVPGENHRPWASNW